MKLVELANELERQKESRIDVIVDSKTVTAIPSEEDIRFAFGIPTEHGTEPNMMKLTDWAHSQVSNKLAIPKKYYDRMRQEAPDLLSININQWMPDKNKVMIRTLDGNIRAVLSDRYKIMDNHDLLLSCLEEFRNMGAELHRADLTENHMYIKAIVPHTREQITSNDTVVPGVIIQNSEVGSGAFRVQPFMLREVCTNGMIGESAITKIHLGKQNDTGLIQFSQETQVAESQALWLQVRDIVRGTFDPVTFKNWVRTIQAGTEVEIHNPIFAVDNVVKMYDMPDSTKEELLYHFSADGDMTQWGLANAVTRTARDMENIDDAIKLEQIGGEIAVMPAKQLIPALV